ncbi:aquaporin-12-like isoform X3 [Heterocephalus glaber]|uniref:Aquaporin-12-like isoform X3 n=1 Tax=Heterocephalus glaber TaxID=10181 RepID=A0AAX6RZ80_HETGA|nr:aquaporin-12-like isoform X3 [Heterocephalus glaber]
MTPRMGRAAGPSQVQGAGDAGPGASSQCESRSWDGGFEEGARACVPHPGRTPGGADAREVGPQVWPSQGQLDAPTHCRLRVGPACLPRQPSSVVHTLGPRPMASLNVSLSFFVATCALCEATRRVSKALLPSSAYASFAREAAGAAQLAACCLEMRVLAELGPWAGGVGPDLLLTLLFLLFLVHGATFDGASANPTVALQEFLLAEATLPSTLLKLVAQALGVQAAGTLTQRCWAWELSDLHLLQSLLAAHCSSALRTSAAQGTLVEGTCAFLFHLTLLHLRHSLPVYRALAVSLLVTVTASTAGPYTSAFFNPALATSVTFRCSGHSFLEYAQVYWLGPLTGPPSPAFPEKPALQAEEQVPEPQREAGCGPRGLPQGHTWVRWAGTGQGPVSQHQGLLLWTLDPLMPRGVLDPSWESLGQ